MTGFAELLIVDEPEASEAGRLAGGDAGPAH
jgi:hypothetical protein